MWLACYKDCDRILKQGNQSRIKYVNAISHTYDHLKTVEDNSCDAVRNIQKVIFSKQISDDAKTPTVAVNEMTYNKHFI